MGVENVQHTCTSYITNSRLWSGALHQATRFFPPLPPSCPRRAFAFFVALTLSSNKASEQSEAAATSSALEAFREAAKARPCCCLLLLCFASA